MMFGWLRPATVTASFRNRSTIRSPATRLAPHVRQAPTKAPQAPQNRSVGCSGLPQLAHAYGVTGLTGPVISQTRAGERNEGPSGPSRGRTGEPREASALHHRGQRPGRAVVTPETVAPHQAAQESTLLVTIGAGTPEGRKSKGVARQRRATDDAEN